MTKHFPAVRAGRVLPLSNSFRRHSNKTYCSDKFILTLILMLYWWGGNGKLS